MTEINRRYIQTAFTQTIFMIFLEIIQAVVYISIYYVHTYCKILNSVIKEAKKQHYSRLIAKSDNKIKTTWNIIKMKTGKMHLSEQMPFLLTNNEKVQDLGTVANGFNNFFLTTTESLNLHQAGIEDAVSFLKAAFPVKFPSINIIPTTENEMKSVINSLISKTHQVMKE
jgi:hypothetical protein